MSSPKFIRVYKSPRSNSGKNHDPKPIKKKAEKAEKSKDPTDKQKRQKQQLRFRLEQMCQKNKHLTTQLNKQRMKNQLLEKQLKFVMQQLRTIKLGNDEKEKKEQTEKFPHRQPTKYSILHEQQRQKPTIRKQYHTNQEQNVTPFQPQSPKQRLQVGGYFGSLFN